MRFGAVRRQGEQFYTRRVLSFKRMSECVANEAQAKRRRTEESSHPLLSVLETLPPDVVERHLGGTALHALSLGFHAKFARGFLLQGQSWQMKPSAFVRSVSEWKRFLSMVARDPDTAESDAALHASFMVHEAMNGNPGFAEALFELISPTKKSRRRKEKLAIRPYVVTDQLFVRAAKAGRIDLVDLALSKMSKYASLNPGLTAAAKANQVDVCVHLVSVQTAIPVHDYEHLSMDHIVVNNMRPGDIVRYEQGIKRSIHPRAYNIVSTAATGNIEAAIWMLKEGKVPSWGNAMHGFLIHASRTEDANLTTIREAIKQGCPATHDAYGRYQSFHNTCRDYFSPLFPKPSVAVITAFHDLTRVRPTSLFIVDALAVGDLDMANAFLMRGYTPSQQAVNGSLHHLSVESLEWCWDNGIRIRVSDSEVDHVLRFGKAKSIAWLRDHMLLSGTPDVVSKCVSVNNFAAFKLMVDDKGGAYDTQSLLQAAKAVRSLDREFIHWFMDTLVINAGVSFESVLVALSQHMMFHFRYHHGEIREKYRPMVQEYLDGLERLTVSQLREKCKLFDVKPKGVRGKGPKGYVDCLRAAFCISVKNTIRCA